MSNPFAVVTFGFAVGSACMFIANCVQFRRTRKRVDSESPVAKVSVLIPARNEAVGIRKTLEAVLASEGVAIEVLVLNDHSEDATEQVVNQVAASDSRVKLIQGQALPIGWCGKQFACHQLANHASHSELLFLDADVHISSDAIRRATAHKRLTNVALLSGFPRQLVGTLGESLLIPLMHIVLLTYLPFLLMRRTLMVGASAGCGQFFLVSRDAYDQVGGHESVKASLHDGVQLPRQFRRAKIKTDVFDASDIASCRMYNGWQQTWQGLAKNAYEGIANERLIVPFTALLVMGFIAPAVVVAVELLNASSVAPIALAGLFASYTPRLLAAIRFDRAWIAAILFPLSVALFVCLQWWALVSRYRGSASTWRGRAYPAPSA